MPIPEQDQQKLSKTIRPYYLFVDDDLIILNLFKTFFSSNAEVVLAMDGEEAFEMIMTQHFDVIVCDVDMPKLNGIDLFKRLHAKDPSINKRFLYCTGRRSPELMELCDEYHIPCIDKPISLLQLQEELVARSS